jgi:ABC-2 type transport system permease protein
LIYLFVWATAAGGRTIGGLGRDEFVTYYLALLVIGRFTWSANNWTVGDAIRSGQMNVLFLRPMSPMYDALASEVAGKVVFMSFTLPLVGVLGLILRPEVHLTPGNSLAFFPALGLAWGLRFFWDYWLALLAYWTTRADALLSLQASLIFLLGGEVAPNTLLPGPLQTGAKILPFRYMLGFPVEVLTGQLDAAELQTGFAIQVGWLVLTFIVFVSVWRSGIKRYTAVGG